MSSDTTKKRYGYPVILLCMYILVEYGRPRFLLPLHPGLILQVVMLWLLIKNFDKVRILLKDGYFMLFLILLLEMAIHGPIAANNYWALMQWLVMISYLIFGLSFCVFVDDAHKLGFIIEAFIFVHVLCAISRIMNSGLFGGSGPLGDKNDFGLAMVVATPLCFYMGLLHNGKKRIAFWMGTVLLVAANVTIESRGAFLGMACGGALIWLKSKSKVKALIVVLMAGVIFFAVIPQDYKAELFGIKDEWGMVFSGTEASSEGRMAAKHGTGKDRVELWKLGWKMFLDNPIIGVGQGNVPSQIGEYQYDEHGESFWQRGMGGRVTHSIYFTVLPELGLVGFLLWVLMVGNVFVKYRRVIKGSLDKAVNNETRMLKNIALGLFAGLIGYLVSGIFLSAFYYPHFWNLSALITTTYLIEGRIVSKQKNSVEGE